MNQSVEKLVVSVNMHYLLFLRDIYVRNLTLKKAEQNKLD